MKKKMVILILVLIVVIGLIAGIIIFNKKDNTNWITDYDYLYDIAKEYIITENTANGHDKNEKDFRVFADYEGFGIEEKDNRKYVYMWILQEAYYVKNDKLRSSSGSSMPYKFTFENNRIIDYEIPKDGTYYASSIRDMFPDSIENKVLMYNMDDSELKLQVKEHYSYLDSTEIVHVDSDEEIILFTGYYGGYTTKAEANTVKGKCIDGYGNVYEYKIPCDENEEMLIEADKIDKEIVDKYKDNTISLTLSKEDLETILNNIENVSEEYKNIGITTTDLPCSFIYIIKDGTKKELLIYNYDMAKENSSEAAKNILDVIAKNNMAYLYE